MNVPAPDYLDHAATTPMREEAIAAMLPLLGGGYNASSAHAFGRKARAALDGARDSVARSLGAKPREIVFTGGGTESNVLAIVGTARAARLAGKRPRVVGVATEHPASLRAFDAVVEGGGEVVLLGVDRDGAVDLDAFDRAIAGATLASVMYVNNETGTIAPVARLARLARERGVTFHTDAVAAAGRLPLDVGALGVDLLSLAGHKFYGPKGVGVLFARAGTALAPLAGGGGQEFGLRGGTENLAGVVALAGALALATAEREAESGRVAAMRDAFEAAVAAEIPGLRVNGAAAARAPHVASLAFPGCTGAELAARLDIDGIAVSAGSACASGAVRPSHVLAALGGPAWIATSTVRFSFGRANRREDVDRLGRTVAAAARSMRDAQAEVGMSGVVVPSSEVYS